MSKNKLIKRILFIIFILIIIGILAPMKTKAMDTSEEFYIWSTSSDSWTTKTQADGDTLLLNSSTGEGMSDFESSLSYYSGGYRISFDEIGSTWWLLCCALGEPLMSYDRSQYGFMSAYYQELESLVANPAEAWQLTTLSSGNTSFDSVEQYSWWNTYIGTLYGTSDADYSLFASGSGFQNYIFGVMGWSSSYNNQSSDIYSKYSSDYTTYTINGHTVIAPNLESVLDDSVKFSDNIDLDGDGKTRADGDVDDEITINYDSEEDIYIVGPFMLEYAEYYSYQNGGIVTGTGSYSFETEEELEEYIYNLYEQMYRYRGRCTKQQD